MYCKKNGAIQRILLLCMACFLLSGCETKKELAFVPEAFGEELIPEVEEQKVELVTVHICGAVVHPGVVSLPKGSRVADALEQVGGFTSDASRDYVNLAQILVDGEQILFPIQSEAEKQRLEEELKLQGKVNLNTATLEELTTLTGIGETRAKDILAYRSTHGDFEKPEDLMQVPGIKESTYEKFKDMIYVN